MSWQVEGGGWEEEEELEEETVDESQEKREEGKKEEKGGHLSGAIERRREIIHLEEVEGKEIEKRRSRHKEGKGI